MSEDNLEHYGVPGMKWGRRRSKRMANNDAKILGERKGRRISDISDADLNKVVNRLRLERNYSQLATPKRLSFGKSLFKKTMSAMDKSSNIIETTSNTSKRFLKNISLLI